MTVDIRVASGFDPALHGDIEQDADELFRAHFGVLPWNENAAAPAEHGYPERLLEAYDGSEVLGFARALELGDTLHLEQLSVHPEYARRGIGAALVRAVLADAAARDFRAVTLRTFADVPWNAPFYERHGFRPVADAPSPFHAELVRTEARLGLLEHGERVHMIAFPAEACTAQAAYPFERR